MEVNSVWCGQACNLSIDFNFMNGILEGIAHWSSFHPINQIPRQGILDRKSLLTVDRERLLIVDRECLLIVDRESLLFVL
jgi:hypothetical protein